MLVTRQYRLHDFLLSKASTGDFYNYDDIKNNIEDYKDISPRVIRKDVREINDDDTIQKIIVSSEKGYKIGSLEEVEKYLKKRFKTNFKALKLAYKIKRKAESDGQKRITFGDYEKDEIEAFIR